MAVVSADGITVLVLVVVLAVGGAALVFKVVVLKEEVLVFAGDVLEDGVAYQGNIGEVALVQALMVVVIGEVVDVVQQEYVYVSTVDGDAGVAQGITVYVTVVHYVIS